MTVCMQCKEGSPYCFSSCDKCKMGLCEKCYKEYCSKKHKLVTKLLISCDKCKTIFKEMCAFCKRQTINYMISDTLMKKHISNEQRDLLNKYRKYIDQEYENNTLRISWIDVPNDIKEIIGLPYDYLKDNFNFCDCDDMGHCNRIAKDKLKTVLGIQKFSLYELGLYSGVICKSCYMKEFEEEPSEEWLCD